MSPAAFALLMTAAEKQFKEAFAAEDMVAIDSALEDLRRINRAYYGNDGVRRSSESSIQAA